MHSKNDFVSLILCLSLFVSFHSFIARDFCVFIVHYVPYNWILLTRLQQSCGVLWSPIQTYARAEKKTSDMKKNICSFPIDLLSATEQMREQRNRILTTLLLGYYNCCCRLCLHTLSNQRIYGENMRYMFEARKNRILCMVYLLVICFSCPTKTPPCVAKRARTWMSLRACHNNVQFNQEEPKSTFYYIRHVFFLHCSRRRRRFLLVVVIVAVKISQDIGSIFNGFERLLVEHMVCTV